MWEPVAFWLLKELMSSRATMLRTFLFSISEPEMVKTVISIFPNSLNWLLFVMETQSVLYEAKS